MSTDYWSIHAALPASAAYRHYCALAEQWSGPGAWSDGADPRIGEAGDEPAEAVELDLERYLEIEGSAACCDVVHSSGQALLALVDRGVALPGGVSLLDGRALAWLPGERRGRLRSSWQRLLTSAGGLEAVSRRLAGHAPPEAVEAELTALDNALSIAQLHRLDLLLICSPSPFGDALEGSSPGVVAHGDAASRPARPRPRAR